MNTNVDLDRADVMTDRSRKKRLVLFTVNLLDPNQRVFRVSVPRNRIVVILNTLKALLVLNVQMKLANVHHSNMVDQCLALLSHIKKGFNHQLWLGVFLCEVFVFFSGLY